MKSSNQTVIRQAFTQQAAAFESSRMSFSKEEYLAYAAAKIAPQQADHILEAAAGTCACGRTLAPLAKSVVCLDMTPAMLSRGKEMAEKDMLSNMTFVLGDAAEMPFLDGSFDIVLSRLAFHHFPNVEGLFSEMVRVLKPGGKLVSIDMEAAEAPLRSTEDAIETMRDQSHVRNLSRDEILALYKKHGLSITCCESTPIPVDLQSWMDLTAVPDARRNKITGLMEQELHGGQKTGFNPYLRQGALTFDQRWLLVIGQAQG